jgi:hypothetical protein
MAHFRSLRSTRVGQRAKAVALVEQLWELTYALERRVELPPVDLPLPSVKGGSGGTDLELILDAVTGFLSQWCEEARSITRAGRQRNRPYRPKPGCCARQHSGSSRGVARSPIRRSKPMP